MNKMVIFVMRHSRFPNVFIKGLVDGDFLFDKQAQEYGEGIIQYYQGDVRRWRPPVNPFMKGSIKWNTYEELKQFILDHERDLALKIFEGDKNLTSFLYVDWKIEREVLTW